MVLISAFFEAEGSLEYTLPIDQCSPDEEDVHHEEKSKDYEDEHGDVSLLLLCQCQDALLQKC